MKDTPDITKITQTEVYVFEKRRKMKSTALDDLRWLIQVRSKDSLRHILQYVHIRADKAEATDGIRLHQSTHEQLVGLPDGVYKVLLNTEGKVIIELNKEETGTFPNCDAVIPDKDDLKGSFKATTGNAKYNNTVSKIIYRLGKGGGPPIDENYLADVIKHHPEEKMTVRYGDELSAIRFDCGTRMAIVMPIRLED